MYCTCTNTFFHAGHSLGLGGSIANSIITKKMVVESVIVSSRPDHDHRAWPRSVSAKSWLTQMGTDAPNMSSNGRKIQLRWLRNRARTYGTSVTPHAHRLIWLYWLMCVDA